MKYSKFMMKVDKIHIVNKDNSQSSNSNSQNIPNVVTSISDNTEDDISDKAYPIKTNVNLPEINDKKVLANLELNTAEIL